MAYRIKVETGALRRTAGAFQSTGNQVRNVTSNMTNSINGICYHIWEGEAANNYKRKFAGLQDEMNRMCNMINEHVNDLNRMASEYDAAENRNSSIANSTNENPF